MGQGFSLATPSAGSAGIEIAQLQDVQYEKSIGNGRFMKSIRGRHENGVVLVKVLVKPFAEVKLDEYRREILKQRKALADVANALAFERVIETETNGYLVRQYMYSSLYDRLSTRPFLEDIEKKWLAFQLLCALRDCHARDVYHGDIKAQNVLVTSWNWLYLADFSSCYKPVVLPDDNPGDFSYFFDTSGRRTCYLAPERFHGAGEERRPEAKMTWAMDIFSAGCVIAQLFLESELFSLAQLYRYRRGEYDPVAAHLGLLADGDVRDMIAHMIQLDPERRYSADQYLEFWKGRVFPAYFYTFLHQYMGLITDPSSGMSPLSGSRKNLGESDERIDRVFNDFDKISFFLGHQSDKRPPSCALPTSRLHLGHFPVCLSMANHEHFVCSQLEPPEDDGTLIFVNLIVSSIRTTARASSRVRGCDILLAFAERLTDEAKLDRILPYLTTLLRRDEVDTVVVSAIRTITQLLMLVRTPTPINSHVLVEYVLPRMEVALASAAPKGSNALVRATYASCLGSLAWSGQRFLEVASTLGTHGSISVTDPEVEPGVDAETNFDSLFDTAGRDLADIVESHAKQLVEDPDVQVRRAFLASVPELCMFFREQSNDILLTHLNTYLNDRDWTLKCAFFDTVVGIAVFIGSTSLEEFMLPLMVQALADAEEFVVQAALHALAQLAGLGLLSRPKIWELDDLAARFTMHPNIWIRESAAEFLSMSAKYLDASDVECIVMPSMKPYLRVTALPDTHELTILDALKTPLLRPVFEQAVTWATQAERSLFWKPLQEAPSLSLGACPGLFGRSCKELRQDCLSSISRNDEDNQWLDKLRNLGLKTGDEMKLVALGEYIWRTSRARLRNAALDGDAAVPTGLVSLKAIGITPQTVFFNDAPILDPSIKPQLDPLPAPYTIAEALLEASMTFDESSGNTRRRQRVHSAGPGPVHSNRRLLSPDRPASRLSERMPRTSHQQQAPNAGETLAAQDSPYHYRRGIRHQPSVLSLLDGKDSNIKSAAETSTSDANAFGEVEGPFTTGATSPVSAGLASRRQEEEGSRGTKQAKHSYEGRDPNIQRMLDRMYADNFPRDVLDFGPIVQPVASSGKIRVVDCKAIGGGPQSAGQGQWKPLGQLVATFSEHKGPINRVVASPDHLFFITGGCDGAVKVWDTARLERNITQRSRQTHRHAPGARVLCLCFVENSHCFVSCASDGSMHVVKVDTSYSSGVVRYAKLRLVRQDELPQGEYAVWCEHFRHEAMSVLVVATNRSRVLGLDLRTMRRLFTLDNPVHHGTPTCFCIDRKRNWLCVGTCHGIVSLWDLRFKMRLKSWAMPGKRWIHRMSIHPTKGRGKWICVAGGTGPGEMTVWDVERTTCRDIYRISSSKRDDAKTYSGCDVDADSPGGMLASFATDLESSDAADGGVRAMAVGAAVGGDASGHARHAYFATGGSDCKLRFWDMMRIEDSRVYSGLEPDEPQPIYLAAHPAAGMSVNTEKKKSRHVSSSSSSAAASVVGNGNSSGSRVKSAASGRPARSTVISMQQQHLLHSHQDATLDMAIIEHPYTMSVSVDRSGVVFVFQ